MNGNNKPKKKWREVAFEDIVVTAAVVIGILGGGIMSLFPQVKSIIIGIFLGMGISSLIYRFLGGIGKDNSFKVIGIKLTGTVAVWIACALIINNELTKQIPKNPNQEDILQKELILTVHDNTGKLMSGIKLYVADDFIDPQKEDQAKYVIPLKKFIQGQNIFIHQESETTEKQTYWNMDYDPQIPRINVVISKNR